MIRYVVPIALVLMTAACTSAGTTYVRADTSQGQTRADATDCTHRARTESVYQRPDYLYYPIQNFDRGPVRVEEAAKVQANMYHRCMTARGYAQAS